MKNNSTTKQPDSKEGLHTHLPWRVSKDGCEIEAPYDGGSFGICSMYADESTQANAELIVKAVNERKALLDALKDILEEFNIEKIAGRAGSEHPRVKAFENAKQLINNAKNIK